MATVTALPGTLVVYSDIACPWATVAVHRLMRARDELGADVHLDHRAYPLEWANSRATPRPTLDAEIPVVGALAPDLGWQVWQGAAHEYPVTTVPALEAVQAAKAQGLAASEQLDHALRLSLFARSQCISLQTVILEVAASCDRVDVDQLRKALDEGAARGEVTRQWRAAQGDEVSGSPHVFAPGGTAAHNPGVTFHWVGESEVGFPVVDAHDESVYADLVRRAAGGG